MAETRTEEVLPVLVSAVQADLTVAADTLEGVAAHLERLEGQLRLDREAATLCRGTASALRTYAGHLRDETVGFSRRVSPTPESVSEGTALRVERGAA